MFGALAGKLLVEGRRAILLNQCVPANCGLSCLEGEGGAADLESILKIFQKEFTPNIPNTVSCQFLPLLCLLFEALYSFLKAILK
jgi:hypothetical protein